MTPGNVEIQEFGSETNVLIRIEKFDVEDEQKELINILKNELPSDVDYRRIEFVGPKVGKELQLIAIKAVLFSLIAMFIYIWFRLLVTIWTWSINCLIP